MNCRNTSLALVAAGLLLFCRQASGQQGGTGQPPNYAVPPIPPQSYAAVDITDSATDQVDSFTLDDTNQAAFAFYSPDGFTYQVYSWQNGMTVFAQSMPLTTPDSVYGLASWVEQPVFLTSTGTVYSTFQKDDGELWGASCTGGTLALTSVPDPPYAADTNFTPANISYTCTTAAGSLGATVDGVIDAVQIDGSPAPNPMGNGGMIVTAIDPTPLEASLQPFDPRFSTPMFQTAESSEILDLGGSAVALNDSNDLFANGSGGAFLIQNGNVAASAYLLGSESTPGLIPKAYQSQVRYIDAVLLSNRLPVTVVAPSRGLSPRLVRWAQITAATTRTSRISATFMLRPQAL